MLQKYSKSRRERKPGSGLLRRSTCSTHPPVLTPFIVANGMNYSRQEDTLSIYRGKDSQRHNSESETLIHV